MSRFSSRRLTRTALVTLFAASILSFAPGLIQAQVVYDAQASFSGTSLISPGAIAVAPDGVIYSISSQKVYKVVPAANVSAATATIVGASTALTPSIALSNPGALAVGPSGELYIADPGANQVIELANPETSGAATKITYSGGTQNPTALAVDAAGSLYVADKTAHAIYKVTAGVSTQLPISPANLNPAGLTVDASGNVYFADALNNSIYKYSGGVTSVFLSTSTDGNFQFSSAPLPIGMGFDPAGNLYVLDSGGGNNADRLFEVNLSGNAQLPQNFQVPFSGIRSAGSMAIDGVGNLYLTDISSNTIVKIFYNNNPLNLSSLSAGTTSGSFTLNYNFIGGDSGVKFFQSMQGDNTGEFANRAIACGFFGYIGAGTQCNFTFTVNYQNTTPGFRTGVAGITDNNGSVLAVPVTGTTLAGALALYPGNQITVADGSTSPTLYEPQGLAVTGNGGTLFVADEGGIVNLNQYTHGNVYAYTNGQGAPKTVSASGAFTTPMGLAVDAAGNLYVADYSGTVTRIPPPWNTIQPAMTIPGVTLYHPMSLAIDPSGNLFIGDMGSAGTGADAAKPGFIVEVPANGAPAKVLHYTVSGAPVIFPQALAFDSQGNLFIADGGDGQANMGGIDVVPAATGVAVALPFSGIYQLSSPSGLSIDAANDLYVLDSYNQRILWAPITYSGSIPSVSTGSIARLNNGADGIDSVLVTASNMVLWPGGQKLTIADIGLQPLTGQSTPAQVVTLDARNAYVDASTGSASVTGLDVGNQAITFATPTRTGSSAFTLAGCGTNSSTVSPGVQNACTSTINYSGSGQQTATFTLNAPANSNYTLGNQIIATASPNLPTGKLVVTNVGNQQITVTLTNIGLQSLYVTNVGLAPGASNMVIVGGTCSPTTVLAQNQSCTIVVSMGLFSGGFLVVTDNNNGIPGSQQQVYLWYFLFGGGGGAPNSMNTTTLSAPVTNQNRPGIAGQALGGSNAGQDFYQPFSAAVFQATTSAASENSTNDDNNSTSTNPIKKAQKP